MARRMLQATSLGEVAYLRFAIAPSIRVRVSSIRDMIILLTPVLEGSLPLTDNISITCFSDEEKAFQLKF